MSGRFFIFKANLLSWLKFKFSYYEEERTVKSFSEFSNLAADYNLIPLYKELISDIETPIALYQRLACQQEYSYLLESSENDRYSFLGLKPAAVLKNYPDYLEIISNGQVENLPETEIIPYLQSYLKKLNVYEDEKLPPFSGGFVGYFSYEMIEKWEDIYHLEADRKLKQADNPLSMLVMTKIIIAYDHRHNTVKIINNVQLPERTDNLQLRRVYQTACAEIEKVIDKLRNKQPKHSGSISEKHSEEYFTLNESETEFSSNTTQAEFSAMVKQAQQHIEAGDIFQLVLSQKFSLKNKLPPFKIYRALRSVNPAPYSFYLNFPELKVIGSSPEVLVRVRDNKVITRPLAGTRPRGENKTADQKLAEELVSDEKERAEHTMLVDLGRNDLSRIAVPGSVEVTELMAVEKYSRVMHIVSQVEAELQPDLDSLDVLKAVFPAGTVSGAPKIKAVELIDQLEKEARGVYAGTVAYLAFNGNLDSCITIRTFSLQAGKLNLQVGAGIVADSQPEKEYQETLNKGRALFEALTLVKEAGLDDFSY